MSKMYTMYKRRRDEMGLYEENRQMMKKYGIAPKKKFGQNFLIDESVLENIVENAEITMNDFVIEIGPGLGNLTKRLCEKAGHVVVIEIDKEMVEILKAEYSYIHNLEIIEADVMKIDLKEVVAKANGKNVKVVANLPYYITTPILMKLLEEEPGLDLIEIMVQKEVADRICAEPTGRDFGAITVAVNYYAEPRYMETVPSNAFLPPPAVDSAVMRLDILKKPKVQVDKKLFFEIVKASFAMKRKTLLNSLGSAGIRGINKEKLAKILEDLEIDLNCRAERLSLENFAAIANAYERF